MKGGAGMAGDAIVGGGRWVGDALANRVEGTLSRQGLTPSLLPSDSKFWIGAESISPNSSAALTPPLKVGRFGEKSGLSALDFIEGETRLGGQTYGAEKLAKLGVYLERRGIDLKIGDEFLPPRKAGGFSAPEKNHDI